ncbi:MAG: energy-coupling factor ABC transporter ATP-binding protein [Candidatus Bathyarchaeum sp.]|nr:MAG: energy-coupling factor ABC transporter ATP-binding protein [Candidatus Bathyarchaeum sp.]
MPSLIQAEDVSYVYRDGTHALKDVSVSFNCGEIVAIIGRNGSGKTTLAKVLTGMFRPTSGRVLVEEKDYLAYTVAELGKEVGYVFQNFDYHLFSDSVTNEIAFGLKNLGLGSEEIDARIGKTLKLLSLERYKDVHPRRLSSGERQSVAIASVLAMKPSTIILDEPTRGQDYKRTMKIMQFVKQLNSEGKLVILISHNISHIATYSQRIVALHDGKIVADGPTTEILGDTKLLEQMRLKPTPIMQLREMLREKGCPSNVFSVDDMAKFIQEHSRRHQS